MTLSKVLSRHKVSFKPGSRDVSGDQIKSKGSETVTYMAVFPFFQTYQMRFT